jgi:hypothetical protein
MITTRYVVQKSRIAINLTDNVIKQLSEAMQHRLPGFGQSKEHPTDSKQRLALDLIDLYKGGRK